jgi:hypothetical protein
MIEEDYAIMNGKTSLANHSIPITMDPPTLDSPSYLYSPDQINKFFISGDGPSFHEMSPVLQARTLIKLIVPRILE